MINTLTNKLKLFTIIGLVLMTGLLLFSVKGEASTKSKIDADVNHTLALFKSHIGGASAYLNNAKGVLVFPKVYGAGIGIGAEYGKGALRIGGSTVAYYNVIKGSFGFQLGAKRKAILILFMNADSLKRFRDSDGFKIGVDADVTVIDAGLGKNFDSQTLQNPIVGFVMDQKGLMYTLSLSGGKITRIHPN